MDQLDPIEHSSHRTKDWTLGRTLLHCFVPSEGTIDHLAVCVCGAVKFFRLVSQLGARNEFWCKVMPLKAAP